MAGIASSGCGRRPLAASASRQPERMRDRGQALDPSAGRRPYASGVERIGCSRRTFANEFCARRSSSAGVGSFFVERSELGPALDPAVVEFIQGGVAVGVATRDDDLRPEFARAWGPEVS